MQDVQQDPISSSSNNNRNNNNNVSEEQAAEAAAQVSNFRSQQNNTADQALAGVSEDAYELQNDPNGLLVQQRFVEFLSTYSESVATDNDVSFPYTEQVELLLQKESSSSSEETNNTNDRPSSFSSTLVVDFQHVVKQDAELAEAIQLEFVRFEPYLQNAAKQFVQHVHPDAFNSNNNNLLFVAFFNVTSESNHSHSVRTLHSKHIGQLTSLTGTITRTSDIQPELLYGTFVCLKCGLQHTKVSQEFHYTPPSQCRNPRCRNTSKSFFELDPTSSLFTDWQKVRLQETSDQIPPGSMPRSTQVILRNEMVETCKAGDCLELIGTWVVLPDASAFSRTGTTPSLSRVVSNQGGVRGLKQLGVRDLTYRTCFVATTVLPPRHGSPSQKPSTTSMSSVLFQQSHTSDAPQTAEEVVMEMNAQEKDDIRSMRNLPHLYDLFAESLAPGTFGHSIVKKGLLLLLLGGVHKTTPDGIQLRGDLNVCIVGDPSTAKSQFLKYIHEFLPSRSVYTSGKASSSAGLTAAVQRDTDTGEYCIEAGALMLADNGICCIDEFDKMDPSDQVAIHEAMEQQTITITKAGIQATLNARASVLAAANPIFGRYDRTKTLKANVNLSAPILSRFDLFFVVLDECDEASDRKIANHILKVHRCEEQEIRTTFTLAQMRNYIRFARTINPRITPESQKVLVDCYRKLRQGDTLGRSRAAYRITVRQLESMIRLSEAMARLHCDSFVKPSYVEEAFRLLKTSIIQVETSDVDIDDDDDDDDNTPSSNDMDDDDDDDKDVPMEESQPQLETQQVAVPPGEYDGTREAAPPKKKKTKITYEEYESMANAIATHLRSLEGKEETATQYLTWQEIVDWYLQRLETDDNDTRKKIHLVIRRLLNKESVLVSVGRPPKSKKEEPQTQLAVHPNYVVP